MSNRLPKFGTISSMYFWWQVLTFHGIGNEFCLTHKRTNNKIFVVNETLIDKAINAGNHSQIKPQCIRGDVFLITARFQTFQIVTPLSCPCEEGGAAWQLVITDVFLTEGSDSRIYVCVRRLLVTAIRRPNERVI